MEKRFEGGESINDRLDVMIAQCLAKKIPLPYVIVLVPANGGVSVARATGQSGEALFNLPPAGTIAASPITVLFVDAYGGTAHFELSESGQLTIH